MIGKHSAENYKPVLEGITIKTLVYGSSTLMAEFKLSKGSILPEHFHPYEQTGYLVSGSITLCIDGNSFLMNRGDSWCIPSGVRHSAVIHEDSAALEIFAPPREDYMEHISETDIIRNDK